MLYLAQTDTTAGFLSKSLKEINQAKNRPEKQACLITTSSFYEAKSLARVPKNFKNLLRRAKKTTFLYPNKEAIRVVKNHPHSKFLDKMGFMYSSSANLHKEKFDFKIAAKIADIIVDKEFKEEQPSRIIKLGRRRLKKIR